MRKPNFFMVGAPKCGTTSVYHYLSGHPDVFLTNPKEPYSLVVPKSAVGLGPGKLGSNITNDPDWYRSLYARAEGEKVVGEASAGYLHFHQLVIPQIKTVAESEPHILIILRNPVERAFSSHIHHIRNNLEPITDFRAALSAQAIRKQENWWFGYQMTEVSLYADAVQAYLSHFHKVKVLLFDDLVADADDFMKVICQFLEIDPDGVSRSSLSEVHNKNLIPRNPRLYRMVAGKHRLTAGILYRLKRHKPFASLHNRVLHNMLFKPRLTEAEYAYLLPDFRDDITRLESILNRDLSRWKKIPSHV
jgi:hypothetical protein